MADTIDRNGIRRYRLLADKARQGAARSGDEAIRSAYEDIALQYEALAEAAERTALRDDRRF